MKKVLFICTGNSARSILAESILNKIGKKKFKALSAGSHPNGVVHPETLKFLIKKNYLIKNLKSNSINEILKLNPKIDYIITVCDNAAREGCPVLNYKGKQIHWSIKDPVSEFIKTKKNIEFRNAYYELKNKILKFIKINE